MDGGGVTGPPISSLSVVWKSGVTAPEPPPGFAGFAQTMRFRRGIDLVLYERPQDERALRVADQDDAAAGIPVREVVAPRVPDVDVRKGVARVQRGSPIPARVTCRYIGAHTRQSCENGAAWRVAT